MTTGDVGLHPPQRVLVAIDGSEASDVAVDLVAGLAWPEGTTFRLIEALDLGSGLFGGPWPTVALVQADRLEDRLRADAAEDLERARSRLARGGWQVVEHIAVRRPATAILDEAHGMAADLVVVGSRGHGTIASMVLGSVSAEVIDHAPAPVLVARGRTVKRIVLAWDGSDFARGAAEAVRTWPILAGAAVRVVSVADIGLPWWTGLPETPGVVDATAVVAESADAARVDAASMAESMAAELREAGRDAVADPREGDAATEIIAAARASDADLVVAGTHGRTGLARIALGSVAGNVVRHAPCSVLVVRAPRHGRPTHTDPEAAPGG